MDLGLIRKVRNRFKYLDLRLRANRQVSIRIVERPGLWMRDNQLQQLLHDLRSVTARGIGADLNYGVLSGDPERLRQAIITVLYDRASHLPIAFNALSVMPLELRGRPVEVLHLGLVVVDPGFRTQGLSWVLYGLTCILLFFRNGMRPLWISNVTQVPAIVGKVAEGFESVYPNPFQPARCSFDHLTLARGILQQHRHVFGVGPEAGFDEDRFVITNAYTGGSDNLKKTFEEAPKHRDPRVNALCQQSLDYVRGDDFLQLARLDLSSTRNYLLREVPRGSLLAVGYQALFLLLLRVILPVIYWLDTRNAYGHLRPRTRQ
jgi:hypothetical protein